MSPRLIPSLMPAVAILLLFGASACSDSSSGARTDSAAEARPSFAATIHPLYAIVAEVAGDRADVHRIAPPGASPHTFELRPGDAQRTSDAAVLFYVHDHLDGWAAKAPSSNRVAAFDLLGEEFHRRFAPVEAGACCLEHARMKAAEREAAASGHEGHGHEVHVVEAGGLDPHFWMDPLAAAAFARSAAETMAGADPDGAADYRRNAEAFSARMDDLVVEATDAAAPARDGVIVVAHPAFGYLFDRLGLETGAVVEITPGTEPGAQEIANIVELVRASDSVAVFLEPQLSNAPARVIAREVGVPVFELDPIGGVEGRQTYRDVVMYNARNLGAAFTP